MEDEHYVCPECEMVSSDPVACTTEGCSRYNQALEPCNCDDPNHQARE